MFPKSPWKYPTFEMKDLHKKIGQLYWVEPTESDIAEGMFEAVLWFRDDKQNLYKLIEKDIRKP